MLSVEFSEQCQSYIVKFTLHSEHSLLQIVYCTLYTVKRTPYNVHCTLYTVHCTLYNCFGDSCGEILRYNGIWDWVNPLGDITHQPCGGSNGRCKKQPHIVGLSEMQDMYIFTHIYICCFKLSRLLLNTTLT